MLKVHTPDVIYGELFIAVQSGHVFADSKTFVDSIPKSKPDTILKAYLRDRHDKDFDLAIPQTFMNRTGHAARCLAQRHSYSPHDILVVYDDVALPLGRMRMRTRGSPGGHRGMESIVESLRSVMG